jgi:AhpD family alkylhydroperoxidase
VPSRCRATRDVFAFRKICSPFAGRNVTTLTTVDVRVELIDRSRAPVSVTALFADGDPGPLVAAWAHVPELLEATLPFVGTILGPSAIGVRPKELVILRTSALLECRYCVDAHTQVALDVGLEPHEVASLRDPSDLHSAFTAPHERALLQWVDGVALGPGGVPDVRADELRRHWRDHEIVELTLLVGATVMLNRFATALRLPTSDATLANLRSVGFPSTQVERA